MTRILGRQESLRDIDDVEAFVIMCIKRSGAKPGREEFVDLMCEGFALLYKMDGDYVDQKDGYVKAGKFSGYALAYLPKKLKEAWHRSQEEHLQRLQPDGTRKWEFHKRAISWDEITTTQEENPLDERTVRVPGNFINPPSVDPSRVRTDAQN